MRLRSLALVAAAPLLALGACSSSPSVMDAAGGGEGVATATGSFNGESVTGMTHALSELSTTSMGTSLEVVLTQTATCPDVQNGPSASSIFLALTLYSTDSSTNMSVAPKGGGEFSLDTTTAGPYAQANLVTLDASCAKVASGTTTFTSGQVSLKSVVDDTAVGSFTLTSGSDEIQGTFITALCVGAGELPYPQTGAACH